MPLFATDDGLILTEEGSSCRAQAGSLNYLFRNSTEDRVRAEYLRTRDFVRLRLAPRWRALSERCDIPDGLEELVQEITLHWMYYYIVNAFPVTVSDSDLAHPQTRRIVRKHVERAFAGLTDHAILAGAILFGVSSQDFRRGIEGDDRFEAIW